MEGIVCSCLAGLSIIVVIYLGFRHSKEVREPILEWPALAKRTGLTYTPGKLSFSYNSPPVVEGEYKGRYVRLTELLVTVGGSDGGLPGLRYVLIVVGVDNPRHFSLEISKKGFLSRSSSELLDARGYSPLGGRYSIHGKPPEFVSRAVNLIVSADPSLLEWVISYGESIRLAKGDIFCELNRAFPELDDMIALLDLLCELAEMVEKSSIHYSVTSESVSQ